MGVQHEFALYRGDDYLATGTARELAKQFGVTPEYIRFLSTPENQRRVARRKNSQRSKVAVKLGPPEDQ